MPTTHERGDDMAAIHKHADDATKTPERALIPPQGGSGTAPARGQFAITDENVTWAIAGDVIRRMDGQQFSKEIGKDAGKWCAEFVKGFVKAMNEKPEPATGK